MFPNRVGGQRKPSKSLLSSFPKPAARGFPRSVFQEGRTTEGDGMSRQAGIDTTETKKTTKKGGNIHIQCNRRSEDKRKFLKGDDLIKGNHSGFLKIL